MCTFEFLVFAYIEIPNFCNCPEGATVAFSHRNVWENHKFQNVISYHIYMLSFQNLVGAMVCSICYKALLWNLSILVSLVKENMEKSFLNVY